MTTTVPAHLLRNGCINRAWLAPDGSFLCLEWHAEAPKDYEDMFADGFLRVYALGGTEVGVERSKRDSPPVTEAQLDALVDLVIAIRPNRLVIDGIPGEVDWRDIACEDPNRYVDRILALSAA